MDYTNKVISLVIRKPFTQYIMEKPEIVTNENFEKMTKEYRIWKQILSVPLDGMIVRDAETSKKCLTGVFT